MPLLFSNVRDKGAIWLLATGALGLAAGLVVAGCSGPRPLASAISPQDRQAFEARLASSPGSPRDTFFRGKAELTHRTVEEVAAEDARLSTTRNPFNANRDPAAVSRGAVVYQAFCMRCHGSDVRGDGPSVLPAYPCKDFHAFEKRFAVTLHGGAPRAWFRKIHDGAGARIEYPDGPSTAMPAFGETLSREQIWLAITYLQSLDAYAPKPADAAKQ